MSTTFFLGPVRGINFHSNQPLFVSGGDDYKIKVGPLLYPTFMRVYCVYSLHLVKGPLTDTCVRLHTLLSR